MSIGNKPRKNKWENRHCRCCGRKKSCGRNHVYVIELNKTVLDDPGYCKNERDHITEDSRLFYVGETNHKPECRYNQHTIKPGRKRKGRGFICTCKNGLEQRIEFDPYNSPSRFVRHHHKKGGLRPEFYSDSNPITGEKSDARSTEKELAAYLKSLGHCAHCN